MAEASLLAIQAPPARSSQGRSSARAPEESGDQQAFSRELKERLQPAEQGRTPAGTSGEGAPETATVEAISLKDGALSTETETDRPASAEEPLLDLGTTDPATQAALAGLPAAIAAALPRNPLSTPPDTPGQTMAPTLATGHATPLPSAAGPGLEESALGTGQAVATTEPGLPATPTLLGGQSAIGAYPAASTDGTELHALATAPAPSGNQGAPVQNLAPLASSGTDNAPSTPSLGAAAPSIDGTGTSPGPAATTPAMETPMGATLSDQGNYLAGLSATATHHQPAPAPATPSLPQMSVSTPVGYDAWAGEVANRVVWMSKHQENTAELILTPPQLGRLEVSVSVDGDKTSAQFVAATPAAREALEQALPRLREALAQSGITLTDASVNTAGQQGQQSGDNGGSNRRRYATQESGTATISPATEWVRRGEGLVDTFA
ncbi:MAG: flagellar hook-length control protein FliK [Rhodocyclaceae bacterium]|nr:flagellar hook-length control protein FliK [Rhodocyclaceae bacterium]